jgi:hypothetical protein
LFEVDDFDYVNLDDNKTRTKTIVHAVADKTSLSSNKLTLAHRTYNSRREFYVSVGGGSAYLERDITNGTTLVALSYDGSTTCTLAANGYTNSFTVTAESMPDMTAVTTTPAILIGCADTAFSSDSGVFDPKSANCNLKKLTIVPTIYPAKMLESLTGLVK